jgi:hypothetical protein
MCVYTSTEVDAHIYPLTVYASLYIHGKKVDAGIHGKKVDLLTEIR